MKEIMNFLPELLRINLVASFVILIVIAARLILKRAPKVFSYALWAIVLIRLLIPVSIPSPVSVIPDTPAASGAVINSALPEIEFETLRDREQNYYESQNTSPEDVQVYVSRTMEPMVYLSLAWIVGIAGMLLYSGISYLKIRKKVRIAVPLRSNIWIADDIKSPFVIGFLKPKIYLPNNLGEQEQEYIILHEQHHIRRLDHVIKTLAFLALTIHWFNPLVWIAFVLACKDMEMSCDEAVIRKIGENVRADYSASLLTLATGHRIIAGTPLAFGEGDTKGRIRNLAKWKKPAIWVLVLTIIICLILGVCLITDRVSRQNQHVGTTFYYGNVTEQSEDRIDVLCNDGTQRMFHYEAGNEDIPLDLTGKQVKIRARLQDVTGNLFTTQVSQVPDTRFDVEQVAEATEAVEAVAVEETAAVDPIAVIETVTDVDNIKEGVSELLSYDFSTLFQMAVDGTISFVLKVIAALAIYYVGRWIIRRVLRFMDKTYEKRNVDVSLRSFLSGIVKVLLYVVVILIVIQVLGINTASLVAMLASAGLAIGMALSGTLQNFAGGVMILFLKPYRVGDYIDAQGEEGTVKSIGLFSTEIITVDNRIIYIPNSSISTSVIDNYSTSNIRRVDWTVKVEYGTDADKVREALLALLKSDSRSMCEPAPVVFLTDLAESGVVFSARVWCKNEDYWGLKLDIQERIYKELPKQGINFPFPKLDVTLRNNE